MAHVQKDIKLMRHKAAKSAQKAADLRKAGKKREAKLVDVKSRAYINTANEMRVMKQKAKKKK